MTLDRDADPSAEEPEDSTPGDLMDELEDEPAPESPRRRRRWRRVLVVTVVLLFSLVFVAAGGLYLISDQLASNITRIPEVFSPLDPRTRPAKPPGPSGQSQTFLLAGNDAQRSDAIMLVRVNAAKDSVVVVSIPRDSWVPVPGHGMAKINAAHSYGGPTLLVRTVELLTNVHIDHFATIDFAGFRAMVDAVGGIDVTVAERTTYGSTVFDAGRNHLDGQSALAYVRQRSGLPRGDLSRVQRQQNALRALLNKASSGGMLADPMRLYRLLDAFTRSVGVDDTLTNGELRTLAYDLRHLRARAVTFLTSPVARTGREGGQSVVYLDKRRGQGLWQALNHDRIQEYIEDNGGDVLGGNPP